MVRVEIDKIHIAIFADHLDFVGRCSIDIFPAEILERALLRFPIHQWSVDFRIFHQRFDVVPGKLFRIFATLKRRYLPTFLAIVGLNRGHALQRELSANLAGPLLGFRIRELKLPFIRDQFSVVTNRLQRVQRVRAALGFDIFRDQLVERWGVLFLSEYQR